MRGPAPKRNLRNPGGSWVPSQSSARFPGAKCGECLPQRNRLLALSPQWRKSRWSVSPMGFPPLENRWLFFLRSPPTPTEIAPGTSPPSQRGFFAGKTRELARGRPIFWEPILPTQALPEPRVLRNEGKCKIVGFCRLSPQRTKFGDR